MVVESHLLVVDVEKESMPWKQDKNGLTKNKYKTLAHTNNRVFAKDFFAEVEPPYAIARYPTTLNVRDVLKSASSFGPSRAIKSCSSQAY